MNNQIWSWLLSIVGVAGFILAGRKIWWAWYINIFCQGLWFAYAVATEQWGFLFGGVIYTIVFVNNAYKWTAEHRNGPEVNMNYHAMAPFDTGPNAEAIYLATKRQLDMYGNLYNKE